MAPEAFVVALFPLTLSTVNSVVGAALQRPLHQHRQHHLQAAQLNAHRNRMTCTCIVAHELESVASSALAVRPNRLLVPTSFPLRRGRRVNMQPLRAVLTLKQCVPSTFAVQ